MNDFIRLMADPAFKAAQQRDREETERQQHERRVRRGSHEPGNAKPSPAELRAAIAAGRTHSFEHELERQARSSKKGERDDQR